MTREEWLRCWGFVDGTPDADTAWAEKQAFEARDVHPMIIRDIAPYQAMGTDVATGKAPMITSRSQHREYLRRNGYIEVGNEAVTLRQTSQPQHEIGRDVKRAIEQSGIRL